MKQAQISNLKFKKRFTYTKNVPFSGADWKYQIIKFEPKKFIKPHYHKESLEVFTVLEGSGILYLNGEFLPLEKDNIYLIEPFDSHGIYANNFLTMGIFKPFEGKDDIYWND